MGGDEDVRRLEITVTSKRGLEHLSLREAGTGEKQVQGRGRCTGEAGTGERQVQGRSRYRGEAGAGEGASSRGGQRSV